MRLYSSASFPPGNLCLKCVSSGEPAYKIFNENSWQKADGGDFFLISEGGIEDTLKTGTAWCSSHRHVVDDTQIVFYKHNL